MLPKTYHCDLYHVYLEEFPAEKPDEKGTFALALIKASDVENCPEFFDPDATVTLLCKIATTTYEEAAELFREFQKVWEETLSSSVSSSHTDEV